MKQSSIGALYCTASITPIDPRTHFASSLGHCGADPTVRRGALREPSKLSFLALQHAAAHEGRGTKVGMDAQI